MNRQRISRRPPDWTESVVIRSYEGPLADPDPPALLSPALPAAPVGLPRLVPAWLVAAPVPGHRGDQPGAAVLLRRVRRGRLPDPVPLPGGT
ncbi:hypothetical protein [Jatrophihabitans sp.]|uniref:hypothetical protein n=1 Tax=Jatrophihabitans sp. TaxID=1932789 RepID=UPI002F0AA120